MVGDGLWRDLRLEDRFVLGDLLYKGGMSYVYLAQDQETGQKVVVKLLQRGESQPSWLKRFRREASVLEQISHPHIVQTHHFGEDQELGAYLVMEWVPGRCLREATLRRRGLVSLPEILFVFSRLCASLSYIHEQGILHRDIKPDNIMILHDPEEDREAWHDLKLIDFGLARTLEHESRITVQGTALGTPHYMAPELAQGKVEPDIRTDLYAMGVMLFELLTGQLPFEGENTYALMSRHITSAPPTFAEIAPHLQGLAEVEDLVRWSLSKEPQARPRSARFFWYALFDTLTRYARHHDPSLHEALHQALSVFPLHALDLTPTNQPAMGSPQRTYNPNQSTSQQAYPSVLSPSQVPTPRPSPSREPDHTERNTVVLHDSSSPTSSHAVPAPSSSHNQRQRTEKWGDSSPPGLRNTATVLLHRAIEEIDSLLGAGIVDLDTGFLVDVYTARPHQQEILDLIAATTRELFEGKQVQEIERLFRQTRDDDTIHYFREILCFSERLIHYFGRLQTNPRVVVVFVVPTSVNLGYLVLRARQLLKTHKV